MKASTLLASIRDRVDGKPKVGIFFLLLLIAIFLSSFAITLEATSIFHPIIDGEDTLTASGIAYVSNLMQLKLPVVTLAPEHPAFAQLIFGTFVGFLSFLNFTAQCLGGCVTAYATYDQVEKARIASAAVSSLGPVMLFLLVRDVTNDSLAGIASAVFLASFPLYVLWSGMAYLDTICATFMIGALFFFYRGYRTKKSVHYLLAGIFGGLSLASKYFGVLTFVIIAAFYVLELPKRGSVGLREVLTKFPLILAAGALTFYLADPIIWAHPIILAESISYQRSSTPLSLVDPVRGFVFIGRDSLGESWGLLETPALPLLGLIFGVAVGFFQLVRWRSTEGSGKTLLLLYFLTTLGFLTASLRKSPYYFMIVVPSVTALAAIGLLWLSRIVARISKVRSKVGGIGFDGVLAALLVAYIYIDGIVTMGWLLLLFAIYLAAKRANQL